MDILLSSQVWLAAGLIFLLRVGDMTLDTLRVLVVMRGRKGFAWLLGFFQASIFVLAISSVLKDLIGDVGRGGMVGVALGLQAACLEESIKFANERILYGKPIAALQTIQNKLADMKIDLEAGSLLAYRAAAMQDKGQRSSNEFAVAKYYTTEACQRAAKMAVDIHGGYGCMEEYAVSRYLRDSYVVGPSAGTSDIMKVIIGRWVLS